MCLQCFPSKHGNLHICHHKSVPKHHFFTMFPIPLSPQTLENTTIYTVFFSFSMLANSNIYTKNHSKTLFFYSAFTMFSVENTVIYAFFGIKSVQNGPNHWFLQCFQCSGIQKPFKISLFTVFFHFCPFFHCRKPTKMTQNSISIPT